MILHRLGQSGGRALPALQVSNLKYRGDTNSRRHILAMMIIFLMKKSLDHSKYLPRSLIVVRRLTIVSVSLLTSCCSISQMSFSSRSSLPFHYQLFLTCDLYQRRSIIWCLKTSPRSPDIIYRIVYQLTRSAYTPRRHLLK
jgi:hypothetical protein